MTILSFIMELSSFVTVNADTLDKAAESNITTNNNKQLQELVDDYSMGMYDDDMDLLFRSVKFLLK